MIILGVIGILVHLGSQEALLWRNYICNWTLRLAKWRVSPPNRACANAQRQGRSHSVSEELRESYWCQVYWGMAWGEGALVGNRDYNLYYGKEEKQKTKATLLFSLHYCCGAGSTQISISLTQVQLDSTYPGLVYHSFPILGSLPRHSKRCPAGTRWALTSVEGRSGALTPWGHIWPAGNSIQGINAPIQSKGSEIHFENVLNQVLSITSHQ